MNRWVCLLRGVTPTGKGRVPMADLREAMASAGFGQVRTYIQSGNALGDSPLSRAQATALMAGLLRDDIGAQLAVITTTGEEIARVLAGNPFCDLSLERVFFGLFNQQPEQAKVEALLKQDFGKDILAITPLAVYCYIPGSAARTKLNNVYLQKKLGVDLTFRNANTLNKLVALAREG